MKIEKNCSAELWLESSYTAVKWGKLGAGRNVSTNVTAYQMPYIHGVHCGYIISSSGGLNVAIFQLMEKLWWLKSGLFLLKVGGILIFQSGNTEN